MRNRIIILMVLIIPLAVFGMLTALTNDNSANAKVENLDGKGKIIKFYSPMCSECKDVAKNVKNAYQGFEDAIILEEIDVTEKDSRTKGLIDTYKITVVPTVIFVDKEGNVINKTEGTIEEIEIRNNLDEIK